MIAEKMSADKSRLLAYLKHTPGFETHMRTFPDLAINDILARVKQEDAQAYQTCISRFEQQGIKLETPV